MRAGEVCERQPLLRTQGCRERRQCGAVAVPSVQQLTGWLGFLRMVRSCCTGRRSWARNERSALIGALLTGASPSRHPLQVRAQHAVVPPGGAAADGAPGQPR